MNSSKIKWGDSIVWIIILIGIVFCISACSNNKKDSYIDGSLVYSKFALMEGGDFNNSIFIFDGKTESKYILNDYKYVFSINDYFSGDFCCECFKEETEDRFIVLLKDGMIEETILIPETVNGRELKGERKFFAFEKEIIFIAKSDLYRIDRQTKKVELIDSDLMLGPLEVVTAKSDGTIAYIKSKLNTEDWVLCIYKDGQKNEIQKAYSVYGWLGSDKLLIKDYSDKIRVLNVSKNITEDPNSVFDGIESELYVTPDYKRCVFYIWEGNDKPKLKFVNLENMSVFRTVEASSLFSKEFHSEQIVYLNELYTMTLNREHIES